ncbi:ArsR family transcriptional regulator [Streptomyces sp. NPDC052051]|uniref:ArsR family transcriptional regulator n=1 Tax=Streptomyces sp. NPDC052051 TaxID=3154649 RepID=UPI00344201CF
MTEDDVSRPPETVLPEHEVRTALLALLAEVGTVTATEAAARLGHSSGLCSFHLRQLARYGRIEEVPVSRGRAKPWRLRGQAPEPAGFKDLARGLEDESYQQWLAQKEQVPEEWRRDEAFSAVVYLTPEEMGTVADIMRRALTRYEDREQRPTIRPEGARPVAVVTRVFPLV